MSEQGLQPRCPRCGRATESRRFGKAQFSVCSGCTGKAKLRAAWSCRCNPIIAAKKVYLCCGNKTGVEHPQEWLGIDLNQPCDLQTDVRNIQEIQAEVIFATPPCDSFTDLPWRRATNVDKDLLIHCLKLCKKAPSWLLECNRWAQKFIGPADFHRSGHYFWGNLQVAEFKHKKMSTSGLNPLKRAALPVVIFA